MQSSKNDSMSSDSSSGGSMPDLGAIDTLMLKSNNPNIPFSKHDVFLKSLRIYGKITSVTFGANFIGVLVVLIISTLPWHDAAKKLYISTISVYVTVGFILFFALFSLVHFAVLYNVKKLLETRYIWLIIAVSCYFFFPIILWASDVPYLYYYGDVLILLSGYLVLCMGLGYCGENQRKIKSGLEITLTEFIVSAASLGYAMFMMRAFQLLQDDYWKLIWRMLIFPIYFEVLVMIPVRLFIRGKVSKDSEVMKVMAVVHAQVHISTMGKILSISFNSYWILFLSALLLNIGKFFGRSSIGLRDNFVKGSFKSVYDSIVPKSSDNLHIPSLEDSISDIPLYLKKAGIFPEGDPPPYPVSRKPSKESEIDPTNFVNNVLIFTEIFSDNASIVIAAFCIKMFYPIRSVFMFPFPEKPLDDRDIIIMITIQLITAIPFDILTLYVNEYFFKRQLFATWKIIMKQKYRYYGYLIYGLMSMGLIALIYMGLNVPRVFFCSKNELCSCMQSKSALEILQCD